MIRPDFMEAIRISSENAVRTDTLNEVLAATGLTADELDAFAKDPIKFIKMHTKLGDADLQNLTAMPLPKDLPDASNADVVRACTFAASAIYLLSFFLGKWTSNMVEKPWVYCLMAAALNALLDSVAAAILANYGGRPDLDGKATYDFLSGLRSWLVAVLTSKGTPEDEEEIQKFKGVMVDVEKGLLKRIADDEGVGNSLLWARKVTRPEGTEPSVWELFKGPFLGAWARNTLIHQCFFAFSVAYTVSEALAPYTRQRFGGPDHRDQLVVQAVAAFTTTMFGFIGAIGAVSGMNLGRRFISHSPPGKVGLHDHLVRDARIQRAQEKIAMLVEKKATLIRASSTLHAMNAIGHIADEKIFTRIDGKITRALEKIEGQIETLNGDISKLGNRIGRETWMSRELLAASLLGKANDAPVDHRLKGTPMMIRSWSKFVAFPMALMVYLNHMLLLQNQFNLYMPYNIPDYAKDPVNTQPFNVTWVVPQPGGKSPFGNLTSLLPQPASETTGVDMSWAELVAEGILKVLPTSITTGWTLIGAWGLRLATWPLVEVGLAGAVGGAAGWAWNKIGSAVGLARGNASDGGHRDSLEVNHKIEEIEETVERTIRETEELGDVIVGKEGEGTASSS